MSEFKPNKITTPAEHRAVLLATIEAVLEGRVNVSMANAVSDLSQQVHNSIRQEWDMRCYAAENLCLINAEVVKMLGVDELPGNIIKEEKNTIEGGETNNEN